MSKEKYPPRTDPTAAAIERAEAQQNDAALLRMARVSRRAKNKFVRRLADGLHGQLREIIKNDQDKLLAVIQMGGGIRVGVEIALPDTVAQALDVSDAAAVDQPSGLALVK